MPISRSIVVRTLVVSLIAGCASFAAAADPARSMPSGYDRDGDGNPGEEQAIRWRVRSYIERHGTDGVLTSKDMLERARWGYERWLDREYRDRSKGVEGDGWISLGPTNGAGRTPAIAPHPTVEDTLLAGAAGGGVWRTTDGGVSWEPLTDGISDLSVGAVAYAPSNPSVIYLGSGEGGRHGDRIPGIGMLRSDDDGNTWFLPDADEVVADRFYAFAVHPTDPDSLLAGTSEGLLATTDGGVTWETRIPAGGLEGVTEIVRSSANPDLLYAALWCDGACPSGLGRVMRSIDGGATWTPAIDGLPTPSSTNLFVNRNSLAVAPSDDQVLYVGLNTTSSAGDGNPEAKIFRSSDGGTTWVETAPTGTYLGSQGWYDNAITVKPTDPNVVVAAGVIYVQTTNGGATWTILDARAGGGSGTATLPHVDGHDLQWQGETLWLGCDGGVWSSVTDGLTWTARNNGLVTRQYYAMAIDPINRERVLGGTQDNGTNLRRDAGDGTWTEVIGGDGIECAINHLLPDVMYGTVQFGWIFRSTDGGTGWTFISPDSTEDASFLTPLTMRPDAPWVLYTGTTSVWQTNDGGTSWFHLPKTVENGTWGSATVAAIAVTPADPEALMVARGSGVFGSANGGDTWRVSSMPARANNVEISPFDSGLAIVSLARNGSTNGQVMRSTNGGLTWQPSGTGLPPFTVQVTRWDPTDPAVVYAGTDVGLYRSTDGGVTWAAYGDGLPAASVHDLRILRDGSMLRVATHGRGMWELNIPQPDNSPPTIDITSHGAVVTATIGDSVDFEAEITDPDGDEVTATWFVTDDWQARSGGSGVGQYTSSVAIEPVSAGRFAVGANATDALGAAAVDSLELIVFDPADNCAAPWVVPASGPFPITILTSTQIGTTAPTDPSPSCVNDPSDPDVGRHGSIWFEFTPAETNRYAISTCGSAPDTVLSTFSGEACGPYLPVAGGCNDDDENIHCVGPRTNSYVELDLEAGTMYRFMVGAYASFSKGSVRFNVECDDCSNVLPGRTYLIAAAASTPGLGGTSWLTDLHLLNPGAEAVTSHLAFLPSGQDNSGADEVDIEVPASAARELIDVVDSVLNADGSGAIRIRADEELLVASRTYNTAADGTFGQFIPGSGAETAVAAGAQVWLVGLDSTTEFRTNIGIANAGPTDASAVIDLYQAGGALVGSQTAELEPYGWHQINQIFSSSGAGGEEAAYAIVRNTSEESAVMPYASVVDKVTGDPTYVTAVPEATAGDPAWIAASAHIDGLGDSVWRSDLVLTNPSSEHVTATIEYYAAGRDNTSRPSIQQFVPAGVSVRLGDVVLTGFGAEGAGALRVSVDGGRLIVTSRTFNQAPQGTFGQFIPGALAASAVTTGERGVLVQLRQNADFRSNVGIVNLTGAELVVTADYHDGSGTMLGTESYTLPPFGFMQDNQAIPGTGDVVGGFAVLTTDTPGGSFLGYASVVDRGSDDPVFIPAAVLAD